MESIFGTRGRTIALGILHSVQVPLNAAQVARHGGMTRPAVAAALDELTSLGIVGSSQVGWTRVYWLVRDNAYVEGIVAPAFTAHDEMADLLERDLRDSFASRCVPVVIFGSYARDEQTPESDVDVVLVAADATMAKEVDELALQDADRFYRRWGASRSTFVYDLEHAANLHTTSPALYHEIERDGVLVSGLMPFEWGLTPRSDAVRDVSRSEARSALSLAFELITAAEGEAAAGHWRVVGINAVQGAISAADAALIAVAGVRSASKDHGAAVELLAQNVPGLKTANRRRLSGLLKVKSAISYERRAVTDIEARVMLDQARRFVAWAASIVASALP